MLTYYRRRAAIACEMRAYEAWALHRPSWRAYLWLSARLWKGAF